MDLQLTGKKAVVTGGSRGIGKAVARRLALEGCDVAIGARNQGPLELAATAIASESGRNAFPLVCDTMDPASITAFIKRSAERLGGIEILVNSAARVGGARGDVETVVPEDVLHDFEEKVVGYLRCARAAVPFMKQRGWGRIVNISGGAGRSPGTQISGGARNSATINMTRALANALGPAGINVNVISPGLTITEAGLQSYGEQAASRGTSLEAVLQEQVEKTLIRHLVTADEIANVVVFLCSPLAIGITGESITVNGGSSADVHL